MILSNEYDELYEGSPPKEERKSTLQSFLGEPKPGVLGILFLLVLAVIATVISFWRGDGGGLMTH